MKNIKNLLLFALISFFLLSLSNVNASYIEQEQERIITYEQEHKIYFFIHNVQDLSIEKKQIIINSKWKIRKLLIKTLLHPETLNQKEVVTLLEYLEINRLYIIIS